MPVRKDDHLELGEYMTVEVSKSVKPLKVDGSVYSGRFLMLHQGVMVGRETSYVQYLDRKGN